MTFQILVIDDDPVVRTVLKRTFQSQGYNATVVSNGEEGIAKARQIRPALIICDWMMTPLDGLEVCRTIKSDPELSTTFFVLLTAKGEVEDRIVGLDAGADEFLSKPIEVNELKARVRAGLRLYQLNEDLRRQKATLQALNQKLKTELDEAAEYVRSLLPSPQTGKIAIETLFQPSAQLGGDCFDYYQLDDNCLAIYLLDVAGHGVGAALLSVSILNVMRSQSLPHTNFFQPSQVLAALNEAFPMNEHGDKYFTIWYGVYHQTTRQLIYANAGHPPAILLVGSSASNLQVKKLGTPSLPIGILDDGQFEEERVEIDPNSTLYIFSDGAYEIRDTNNNIWGIDSLIELLIECKKNNFNNLKEVIEKIRILTTNDLFEDDLSLLKVGFIN
ncbi:MAG: SpoIIE family protein phosphatase [Cyanosarcina radialis HA8281-LM2]|jgi:sigma-B regulation protein RsbU (phosphoserine phosphatase)|nr:SpoIIE family protein phosphatase [Cyanosarcina radialis HA8281-LM2]